MWRIISAEFVYHRKMFLSFLCFIPLFWLLAAIPLPEDLPAGFWMFMFLFMLLQNWTVARNKELRDRKHMLLPVSALTAAADRVLVLTIAMLSYIGLYFLVAALFQLDASLGLPVLLKVVAFIFTGFVLYFILRDQTKTLFVRMGLTGRKMMLGLGLLLVALNLFGLVMFYGVQKSGHSLVDLKPIANLLVKSNPFTGVVGVIKFLCWTSVLGALTIISFLARRSYLK